MIKILTVSNVSFASSLNEQAKHLRQGRQQNKHAPTRCHKRPVQLLSFLGLEEEVSVLLFSVPGLHPLALMLVMIVKYKLMLSLCELSLSSYYSRPLCTFFGNILCKYPHQTPLLYVNGTWRLEMLVLDFT